MRPRSDVDQIKALLQDRIVDLVHTLAPGGVIKGNYWLSRSPARNDRHAGSFWVTIRHTPKGPPGVWKDEGTGDKGDVFSLIQLHYGWPHTRDGFIEAVKWARKWLNFEDIPVKQRAAVAEQAAATRAREEKDAAEKAEKNARAAKAWWLSCEPELAGTVAETYLGSRGIPLADLKRPPRVLRFAPELVHGPSQRTFPAIVAAMTDAAGAIRAVHRTYLAPDGSGKAPVSPARMIWPTFAGCVIRLTRGETDLSPEEATRRGLVDRLLICEGIEDGLSFALACPELRIWAAGSLANLANVKLPDCTWEVIVAADNDWGKPQAQAQLQRALEALGRQRRPVRVARSHIGKDANDALRGAA